MRIACVHIPRFAVEAERQRRPEIAARLILIGEASVLDCSLGADASGVRRGTRMSEAIALCHKAVVLAPDAPHYQRLFEEVLGLLGELSPEIEAGDAGTANTAGEREGVRLSADRRRVRAGQRDRATGPLRGAAVACPVGAVRDRPRYAGAPRGHDEHRSEALYGVGRTGRPAHNFG
jgi:impB/mucB/samB family.